MSAKRIFTVTAAAALFLAAGAASATIIGTKHDMTTNGNYDSPDNSTGQVCVYCHTPHNATASTNGPIWNRANTGTSYTMYGGGSTSAGTDIASEPGRESMACLSCHDGSTAVDSISNVPGPGNTWATNGASGQITGYALVGDDLSDDHPVSLQYLAGTAGLKNTAAALSAGITLYGASDDQVECASCHSVHDNDNPPFLRVLADNSDICTACHDR